MLRRIRELFARKSAASASPDPKAATGASRSVRIERAPEVVHRPIPESDLDPDAVKIIKRLTRFDHTAYLVGGCVRDLLLDRSPKDYDIGTSATPRQVKRLFRNCRIIGRRFRLAHIYFHNRKVIEVATFRALDSDEVDDSGNGAAGDDDLLIRDDNVFGSSAEDALRRDFTVNQLFYDLNNETVIDHADGLRDLKRRVVSAIGDPATRFCEDPIRILRAIKFAARLDFEIEPATYNALIGTINELPKAAPPRILEEINRFCMGGASRRSFELLQETGAFDVILPEFAEAYKDDREAWMMLFRLLDEIDHRLADGKPTPTGAIFAVLLLPLLARHFGWREDGSVEPPKGLKVRELADQYLRPLALRLRVARRDQEYCRQTLMTLYRMAPAERVRRQNRKSMVRRSCLVDALWILETCAEMWGGELTRSSEAWEDWAKDAPPPEEMEASDQLEEGGRRRGGRRRGGRGRGRGRNGDRDRDARDEGKSEERDKDRREGRSRGEGGGRRRRSGGGERSRENGDARKSAKGGSKPRRSSSGRRRGGPTAEEAENLPPVWDDRYFFAALPTVPDSDEESFPAPEPEKTRPRDDGNEEERPRRRRSRGGRSRRRGSKPASGSEESGGGDRDD